MAVFIILLTGKGTSEYTGRAYLRQQIASSWPWTQSQAKSLTDNDDCEPQDPTDNDNTGLGVSLRRRYHEHITKQIKRSQEAQPLF